MKMSMEHWWNDTGRGKQKYSEKNMFNCQFVHKSLMGWPRGGTRSSVVRGRQQTARPMARPLGYRSLPEFYVTVEFVPRSKHSDSVNVV